ncbi:MAG: class I SAM-dependent methyltransferase, partial [Planctomycetota bacterium]|nr:class I SAM-dependent methyltransferase [Planctomycetota bacterium]
QVTEEELARLVDLAARARVVVEVGCFEARTSVALARATPGLVHSIDPFLAGRLGICYSEWIARVHRRRQGATNLVFHRALGHLVAEAFAPGSVDLVFIDGDHSWVGIDRDWEAWLPRVRVGGWLALHDCIPAPSSPRHLGSMDYWAEQLRDDPRAREVDRVGSMVVLERRAIGDGARGSSGAGTRGPG